MSDRTQRLQALLQRVGEYKGHILHGTPPADGSPFCPLGQSVECLYHAHLWTSELSGEAWAVHRAGEPPPPSPWTWAARPTDEQQRQWREMRRREKQGARLGWKVSTGSYPEGFLESLPSHEEALGWLAALEHWCLERMGGAAKLLPDVVGYARAIRGALSECGSAACKGERPTPADVDYLAANECAKRAGKARELLPLIEDTAAAYVKFCMAVDSTPWPWPGCGGQIARLPENVSKPELVAWERLHLLERELEIIESELQRDATDVTHAAVNRKRRGRRMADYETEQREAALYDEWQRAKAAKTYKGDFARDKGMSLQEFDKLLERVAKRKSRAVTSD